MDDGVKRIEVDVLPNACLNCKEYYMFGMASCRAVMEHGHTKEMKGEDMEERHKRRASFCPLVIRRKIGIKKKRRK